MCYIGSLSHVGYSMSNFCMEGSNQQCSALGMKGHAHGIQCHQDRLECPSGMGDPKAPRNRRNQPDNPSNVVPVSGNSRRYYFYEIVNLSFWGKACVMRGEGLLSVCLGAPCIARHFDPSEECCVAATSDREGMYLICGRLGTTLTQACTALTTGTKVVFYSFLEILLISLYFYLFILSSVLCGSFI